MAYPVNIVMNDRNWYDSRIIESDPVVFQNVNYTTGNDRSVNKVRHRFMQDWARRIIPNSIRQGIGLGDPAGGSDQITVTEGYAIVGGRFINVPAGTYDASDEGLTGSGGTPVNYYLVIKVADFIEGDIRDPSSDSASLEAIAVSGYTKSHNELVLAKFRYNGSVIDQFVDYTAEQEWQANILSPVPARPGLTTGDNKILLRAGGTERIDNLAIETDKTRFYLNAVFNDQVASTEVKLVNNSGILKTRNLADSAYLGQDMLNLKIGGTERITSSGNLVNITTINTQTLGDNTANSFVMRTSTQTLTNKTLTSPTVTDGTFSSPVLTTPQIEDTSANHQYIFAVSELTADRTVTLPLLTTNDTFVFATHPETLTDKTLTDAIFTSFLYADGGNRLTVPNIQDTLVTKTTTDTLSNKTLATLEFLESGVSPTQTYTIVGQELSADRTLTIPASVNDTFLMRGTANPIGSTGSITFATDNTFVMTGDVWSSATHIHDAADQGGTLNLNNASDGTALTVAKGGTGLSTLTDGGILYATSTTTMSTLRSSNNYSFLFQGSTGDPTWVEPQISLTGDVTGSDSTVDSNGDWSISTTVVNDSHSHDTQYYTEGEVDDFLHIDNGNGGWYPCVYYGNSVETEVDVHAGTGAVINTSTTDTFFFYHVPVPPKRGSKDAFIGAVRVVLSDYDSNNYIKDVDIVRTQYDSTSATATVVGDALSPNGIWHFYGFTGFNGVSMTGYDQATVRLSAELSTINALDILGVWVFIDYR